MERWSLCHATTMMKPLKKKVQVHVCNVCNKGTGGSWQAFSLLMMIQVGLKQKKAFKFVFHSNDSLFTKSHCHDNIALCLIHAAFPCILDVCQRAHTVPVCHQPMLQSVLRWPNGSIDWLQDCQVSHTLARPATAVCPVCLAFFSSLQSTPPSEQGHVSHVHLWFELPVVRTSSI